MKMKDRLNLISKIGYEFNKFVNNNPNDSYQVCLDGYWLIGMLSDTSLSDKQVDKELEQAKKEFPKYKSLLTT